MLRMIYALFLKLLFAGTMFFAAGAQVLDTTGGGDGGAGGDGSNSDAGGTEDGSDGTGGAGAGGADGRDLSVIDSEDESQQTQQRQPTEEPELGEFKGIASNRVKGLVKMAPALAEIFKEKPEVQNAIEASFRVSTAMRECFPTVAEARQIREALPNGLADLQTLQEEVGELDQLDKLFYSRDQDGNYAGHRDMLANMYQDDRQATVALFRTLPKEWARLDPDSYNEVMGKVVGATFLRRGIPDYLGQLINASKVAKQDAITGSLEQLLNWVNGYTSEKPRPSAEEERLQRERQAFDRQRTESSKQEQGRFHRSFVSESSKLQESIVKAHPAVARMLKASGVPEAKKAEIIRAVRGKMEQFLAKSPSFMKKLRPAHAAGDIRETLALQKAAWSQQWLLNRMVREVMAKEVPTMVAGNRAGQRRTGPQGQQRTQKDNSGDRNNAPKKPHQVNGVWYKADGTRFSTAEVLAGKHLSA